MIKTDRKYNIIYADPPWSYKVWGLKNAGNGNATKHYDVLHVEHIKALNVSDLAEKNCILFLWVTFPQLAEGLEVIKSWGFKYKTVAFTWVKRNKKSNSWFFGLGHYTRANAEVCLLATKGTIERQSASVHQIIDTPIERHSKKPDVARDKIVELMGDLPRIELFARETAKGWDSWGKEL